MGATVDPKSAAAVFAKAAGEPVNVTLLCRGVGLSPKTFYRYLARYQAMGVAGFFSLSRHPPPHASTLPDRAAVSENARDETGESRGDAAGD
ncbi:MAG: hypothetical protein QOG10_1169 [Kribbellaceae bacterium]|nr:hypothetical protein [Kribbellaceae bacterium]